MRNISLLIFLIVSSHFLRSQTAADLAVQLSATVQNNPAQITLSWPGNATTTQYQVFRKLKTDITWGSMLASLPGSATQFIDNTVTLGVNYEYRLIRTGNSYTGYGYINSGIEVPEIEHRGKLLLMVDSTFISSLASEIARLIDDMEGDGWEVKRHDVLRTGSVTHVKELIVSDYAIDSAKIKAVFLLGHVPVPYSGNINPDGHSDHLGAWPADVYYGDVDGLWTDQTVNSTAASPPRTKNSPGDGKFDQSIVPGEVELQVGRVDLSGLPSFSISEQQLLKNYLDKDHDYRKKIFTPIKRAVIDDNFGYFAGEAFAASAYKNFGPLVGTNNVTAADYFVSMGAGSYAWSFGCGGGTYSSASGVGNTANFASSNLQGVFTMLFGSYFGDWDAPNSFLKAPLAQGKILTSVWSGRPHFQLHHMGLGENIGYGLWITQNNSPGLYFSSSTGIGGNWVHNALLGDPTLRNDAVTPVSNVVATRVANDCHITWSASTETLIAGYNLYMKNDSATSYVKLNAVPITSTGYTHQCLVYKGVYKYMVRAIKLETNPSGSYYNMSEGIADTAYNTNNYASIASFSSSVTGDVAHFTNTAPLPATYAWDFGNGTGSTSPNPSAIYQANGTYTVMLIATHPCYVDTSIDLVNIVEVGLQKNSYGKVVVIFPNPTSGSVQIACNEIGPFEITLYNTEGKKMLQQTASREAQLDLKLLPKGLYVVKIKMQDQILNKKLVIE